MTTPGARERPSIGQRISGGLALAGALLAFVFAAYLLIVGPDSTFVTPDGLMTTAQSPTLAGLVPLGIGVFAVWAVARRRTSGYWVAAALAIVATVLFSFSISLQLAAIAVFLLLAAVLRTITTRDIDRR
ncbi:MAG: hypothetical protein ABIZ52_00175 [Candidatus Limnocylindrales bacterium]